MKGSLEILRFELILIRALLYCGRYPDTKVHCSVRHPSYHLLLLTMAHLIGSDLPIGQTLSGQPCYRLAILFHWGKEEEEPRWTSHKLEIKMLSITDMFAILPCP